MISSIKVALQYKLLGQQSWEEVPITAAEYFDANYTSEDERLDIDDVPLYDHAVEYLKVDNSLVENTRLTLIDNERDTKRIIVETFWNNGANRIIERRDYHHGLENYWEMIIDSQVIGDRSLNEIIRIGRKDGVIMLLSHVFIATAIDGSQTEI